MKLCQDAIDNPEYIEPPDDINMPVLIGLVDEPEEWFETFEKELKRRDNEDWNDVDTTLKWLKRKGKNAKTIQSR